MLGKLKTAVVAKAATALTSAYASGWDSGTIDTRNFDQVRLLFAFVWNDATSIEFQLQFSSDEGTTWFTDHRVSSGTATRNEVTLAVTASLNFALAVDCKDYTHLRVQAKYTGGSAGTDSLALSYTGGVR